MIQTNDSFSKPDTGSEVQSEYWQLHPDLTDPRTLASDCEPSPSTGIVGTMMKMYNEHQSAVKAAEEARFRRVAIKLPPEPAEEISELPPDVGFWDLLEEWADYHQVDPDLALLVCACATAHAAGPKLLFQVQTVLHNVTAPTLLGHAEDMGFHQAVKEAIAPYLAMQKELEIRYGPLRKRSYRRMGRERFIHKVSNAGEVFKSFNVRGVYPGLEPEGTVRFVIDGKLPRMAYQALPRCHHYTAMSVGEIEELPRSTRAKEDRAYALFSIIHGYGGYRHSKGSIRGFMRFSAEDLEWVLTYHSGLSQCTLPFRSELTGQPTARMDVAIAKASFDRIHRKTARHILQLRYDDSECGVDFGDEQAAEHHRQLLDAYKRVSVVVSDLAPGIEILSDVIVWYLLHLSSVSGIRIAPMDIATRANEVARRLRRRVMKILNHYQAVRLGRLKRKQVLRLLERMERLGVPSTPRDIARGLNKQRMEKIRPLIDFLVEHHVFVSDRGKLRIEHDAREVFEQLPLECFMPALREVPFSLIKLLEHAEHKESSRVSAQSLTPSPN